MISASLWFVALETPLPSGSETTRITASASSVVFTNCVPLSRVGRLFSGKPVENNSFQTLKILKKSCFFGSGKKFLLCVKGYLQVQAGFLFVFLWVFPGVIRFKEQFNFITTLTF